MGESDESDDDGDKTLDDDGSILRAAINAVVAGILSLSVVELDPEETRKET
jgi:hypothetical protein